MAYGRLVLGLCTLLLPVAASGTLGASQQTAVLLVGAVGLIGVGLLWYPYVAEWRRNRASVRDRSPEHPRTAAEAEADVASRAEVITMRRLRMLAGGVAAVGIALSAVTQEILWSGVAVVGAIALLLVVLRERRLHSHSEP